MLASLLAVHVVGSVAATRRLVSSVLLWPWHGAEGEDGPDYFDGGIGVGIRHSLVSVRLYVRLQ